jgi:hypothetical protein
MKVEKSLSQFNNAEPVFAGGWGRLTFELISCMGLQLRLVLNLRPVEDSQCVQKVINEFDQRMWKDLLRSEYRLLLDFLYTVRRATL